MKRNPYRQTTVKTRPMARPVNQSAGILDDHAVRKVVQAQEMYGKNLKIDEEATITGDLTVGDDMFNIDVSEDKITAGTLSSLSYDTYDTFFKFIGAGSLGTELITNGTFDADTDWVKNGSWLIPGDGTATYDNITAGSTLQQNSVYSPLASNYQITYTITEVSAGGFRVYCDGYGTYRTAAGTYSEIMDNNGVTTFYLLASNATGAVDNISVKEVDIYFEDLSGNDSDMHIVTPVTYEPNQNGEANKAMTFDGATDYIRMDNPDDKYNLRTDDLTVNFWARLDDTSNQKFIQANGYYMQVFGNVMKAYFDGTEVSQIMSVDVGNWAMYSFVYDRDGLLSLYRNGELQNTADISYGVDIDFTGGYDPIIFGSLNGTDRFINGAMSELSIVRKALSAADISAIYNASGGVGTEFKIRNQLGDTQFIVTDEGDVGIGVAEPSEKLEVNGNISADKIILDTTTIEATPEAGMIEYDGDRFYITNIATQRAIDRTADVALETVTVTDTTTETTIFTALVPANSLRAGNVLKLLVAGIVTTASAADVATINLYAGDDLIATIDTPGKVLSDDCWQLNGYATIRTTGASGLMAYHLDMSAETNTSETCDVVTLDTTAVENVTVKVQWNNAKAGNSFSLIQGFMTYKN